MDRQAVTLALHSMSMDELVREAKHVDEKARTLQGLAARLKREIKRRNRKSREA